MYYYLSLAVLSLLVIWTIGSYLFIRNIEEPKYSVLEKKDGYEIRQYSPYIVAETTVTGEGQDALSSGFRIIADYIFGNNTTKSSIKMTTPVLDNAVSEKISMTTPVLDTKTDQETRKISFVLPSEYTIETLPKPNNDQVNIRLVPEHKVAVLRFSWYPTTSRINDKKQILKSLLEKDNLEITDNIQVARYNPPLSIPFVLRNEIIIPIK